ncbi:SDR family NAD(P)-dependent oxidoreductase [Phenylobacterium sp.]|uniref:SDR family NAD(P)-dependent oxidoreductase n=1 Tax=Phenylobacterium sp. TaxID=1871053 RepID=UPI00273451AB|nr:SDR family NAD(P)-dependent oxidoreductase [Phenylobacterium sp.]MDP3661012.1 SDR family NAD(P)-dependent oxidoreductase [Phenylobacterium sp.]
MNIQGITAVVTGGASGLGRATAERLLSQGAANVVIVDLASSPGEDVARELGAKVKFVAGDVTNEAQMQAVFAAAEALGPVRATVHCAGGSKALRVLDREGQPGALDTYASVITLNLVGSFNVLRLAAASSAKNELVDGERGVVILTASIAAYEGQIGQIPYASSKAGIVGMTLVAARDLAQRAIRVCTIAPGIFDTPLLARLPQDVRDSLGAAVPHPSRLGVPPEFAQLAAQIIENSMLNGETIRLDGALRMAPR